MIFKEEQIKKAFSSYENGKAYKEQLGSKGMFRQNKINERFFIFSFVIEKFTHFKMNKSLFKYII